MKNYIFKLLMIVLSLTTILHSSCKKEESVIEDGTVIQGEQYFYDNVAIFDVRNRSINEREYIKEIYFVDFGNGGKLPSSFEYDGKFYEDDGSGNDQRANDGVFTSTYRLAHGSVFPFDPSIEVKSVTDDIIIMTGFKHRDALEQHQRDFSLPKPKPSTIIELSCKIKGGKSGCLAEKLGWCSKCCFTVGECEIKIGV